MSVTLELPSNAGTVGDISTMFVAGGLLTVYTYSASPLVSTKIIFKIMIINNAN